MKRIALLRRDKHSEEKPNPKFEQCYSYVRDVIATKIFKPRILDNNKTNKYLKNVFTVIFRNKAMQQINLEFSNLGFENFHIPATTYRLTPTIRNKMLNYKKIVQSIIVDDEI